MPPWAGSHVFKREELSQVADLAFMGTCKGCIRPLSPSNGDDAFCSGRCRHAHALLEQKNLRLYKAIRVEQEQAAFAARLDFAQRRFNRFVSECYAHAPLKHPSWCCDRPGRARVLDPRKGRERVACCNCGQVRVLKVGILGKTWYDP